MRGVHRVELALEEVRPRKMAFPRLQPTHQFFGRNIEQHEDQFGFHPLFQKGPDPLVESGAGEDRFLRTRCLHRLRDGGDPWTPVFGRKPLPGPDLGHIAGRVVIVPFEERHTVGAALQRRPRCSCPRPPDP